MTRFVLGIQRRVMKTWRKNVPSPSGLTRLPSVDVTLKDKRTKHQVPREAFSRPTLVHPSRALTTAVVPPRVSHKLLLSPPRSNSCPDSCAKLTQRCTPSLSRRPPAVMYLFGCFVWVWMWQVLMSAMLSSQTKDPVTAAGVNRMREVRK